jgi:hypothetical protein
LFYIKANQVLALSFRLLPVVPNAVSYAVADPSIYALWITGC